MVGRTFGVAHLPHAVGEVTGTKLDHIHPIAHGTPAFLQKDHLAGDGLRAHVGAFPDATGGKVERDLRSDVVGALHGLVTQGKTVGGLGHRQLAHRMGQPAQIAFTHRCDPLVGRHRAAQRHFIGGPAGVGAPFGTQH